MNEEETEKWKGKGTQLGVFVGTHLLLLIWSINGLDKMMMIRMGIGTE